MLVAALDSSAETVDALVGLALGETLEGNLDALTLLLVQIIVSRDIPCQQSIPSSHHPADSLSLITSPIPSSPPTIRF